MSNTTDEWAWLDEITTTYKERTDMGSIDLIDVPLNDDAKQSLKSHFEQMMREARADEILLTREKRTEMNVMSQNLRGYEDRS